MSLANQGTWMPTNKGMVMSAVMLASYYTMDAVMPQEIVEAWGVVIAWGLSLIPYYLTPDRLNIPR